ncbi:MAG: DUF1178 family protein [Paracoccaceae bacterium]|nr:DUF1178 family protein [Paracoccaceae bacterium]
MIRYSLRCDEGHEFEAWFRSSEAFDAQREAGHVTCGVCGSAEVEKAIMAPSVGAKGNTGGSAIGDASIEDAPLSKPASPAEAMLKELRAHVEKTSDYVGKDFAAEARRIHDGEADKRGIWGEATKDDAKALKDDGIPVAPIPWMRRGDG